MMISKRNVKSHYCQNYIQSIKAYIVELQSGESCSKRTRRGSAWFMGPTSSGFTSHVTHWPILIYVHKWSSVMFRDERNKTKLIVTKPWWYKNIPIYLEGNMNIHLHDWSVVVKRCSGRHPSPRNNYQYNLQLRKFNVSSSVCVFALPVCVGFYSHQWALSCDSVIYASVPENPQLNHRMVDRWSFCQCGHLSACSSRYNVIVHRASYFFLFICFCGAQRGRYRSTSAGLISRKWTHPESFSLRQSSISCWKKWGFFIIL